VTISHVKFLKVLLYLTDRTNGLATNNYSKDRNREIIEMEEYALACRK
jgi:hypothetical protein